MPHKRADSKTRQSALDLMFQALTELEGVVTESETRDQRMSSASSARRQETESRFPAFGVKK
jgi:hypothetical protein